MRGTVGRDRRSESITVRDALRMPSLRIGAPEVLAGRRNLGRSVRWAHVSEVANIAELLQGAELLLTTGVGIARTAKGQKAFIDALENKHLAALVVELGQRFKSLPEALTERAEARGLPLIVLHREIPFVAVTEAIHANILGRQYAALRRGEQAHRRFTRLMIDGAGIPEIVQALAETIGNPVLLEKPGSGVLYHATYRTPSAEVLAAAKTIGDGSSDQTLTVPVPAAGGTIWGRLVALDLDSPLDDFSLVTAERAVELVALALLRGGQEADAQRRERGNLLAELAAGQLTASDAAYQAEALGFTPRPGGVLMPAAAVTHAATRTPRAQGPPARTAAWVPATSTPAWAPIWEEVTTQTRSGGTPLIAGPRIGSSDTLIILSLSHGDLRAPVASQLAQAIHKAVAEHLGAQTADMVVLAVGSAVKSWDELPAALADVAETAQLAQPDNRKQWHDATIADIGRLLARLQYNQDLQRFTHKRLQPLIEHDRRHATKLLPTLQALLEHQGQKSQTARALHLERQSLYARIHNLEALLDVNLNDADTRLGLHLALKTQTYLQRD